MLFLLLFVLEKKYNNNNTSYFGLNYLIKLYIYVGGGVWEKDEVGGTTVGVSFEWIILLRLITETDLANSFILRDIISMFDFCDWNTFFEDSQNSLLVNSSGGTIGAKLFSTSNCCLNISNWSFWASVSLSIPSSLLLPPI